MVTYPRLQLPKWRCCGTMITGMGSLDAVTRSWTIASHSSVNMLLRRWELVRTVCCEVDGVKDQVMRKLVQCLQE